VDDRELDLVVAERLEVEGDLRARLGREALTGLVAEIERVGQFRVKVCQVKDSRR
jgi:hypothetical protein